MRWIKMKEVELNEIMTLLIRKDESNQYDKALSLLQGKFLINFRNHRPFKSSIELNGIVVESKEKDKIQILIADMFQEIKSHIQKNYNIDI